MLEGRKSLHGARSPVVEALAKSVAHAQHIEGISPRSPGGGSTNRKSRRDNGRRRERRTRSRMHRWVLQDYLPLHLFNANPSHAKVDSLPLPNMLF